MSSQSSFNLLSQPCISGMCCNTLWDILRDSNWLNNYWQDILGLYNYSRLSYAYSSTDRSSYCMLDSSFWIKILNAFSMLFLTALTLHEDYKWTIFLKNLLIGIAKSESGDPSNKIILVLWIIIYIFWRIFPLFPWKVT